MAPEQIVGNPEEASDVYSVGVVAWELLTRQRAKDNLVGMSLEWHVKAAGLPQAHSSFGWKKFWTRWWIQEYSRLLKLSIL